MFADIREFPAELLDGVDAVVHLSAISNDPMGSKFEAVTGEINRDATVRIAETGGGAGGQEFYLCLELQRVRRRGKAVRATRRPTNPLTAYARSKIGSEKALAELDRKRML